MSGLNIGGIGTGVQKGIQYDMQYLKNLLWAAKTKNTAATEDLLVIAETNVKEVMGTAVEVGTAQVMALIFNPDTCKGSRQLMHEFEAKYGNH